MSLKNQGNSDVSPGPGCCRVYQRGFTGQRLLLLNQTGHNNRELQEGKNHDV